ncbi:caudovirus prohead protease [Gracilibacillus oryzae]|uniref:Caudovirus prohead protease n=1 Tax=Gracilibacillus oryzae TaxID=1672701 RepID=A0A7C8GQR1_9BACI|nr:HK97 family phage prohead protease [Gracilibacillus oryzae]KAB8126914.1 caudovirus prohead protease [Gracilibacillus oryzae]
MTKRKTIELSRDTTINAKAIDDEKRQVELSFSSEEPYDRWFGPEILSHNDGACDLTRLNEIGCLLYNHSRDKVIGRIDKAWVENGRGLALVTFDEDEASEVIYQKVKNKTLKGVSVGYRVDSWEEVGSGKTSSDGRFKGPCNIALKWLPLEISIVSIPADASVGVGREMESGLPFQKQTSSQPKSIYFKQIQLNENYVGGRNE